MGEQIENLHYINWYIDFTLESLCLGPPLLRWNRHRLLPISRFSWRGSSFGGGPAGALMGCLPTHTAQEVPSQVTS